MIVEASVAGRSLRLEVRPSGDGCTVSLDGRPLQVDVVETADHFVSLLLEGRSHELRLEPGRDSTVVHFPGGRRLEVALGSTAGGVATAAPRRAGVARVLAPMPGRVVRVLVVPGQAVEAGQGLLVVEAMKMENELRSPRAGRVQEIAVREGQAVETGALLVLVT